MTKDEAAKVIEALKKRQNKLEKIDSMLRRLNNRKFSIEVINGDEFYVRTVKSASCTKTCMSF